MFLWLKTLYRKRAVTWPFIFYTIIWTLSITSLIFSLLYFSFSKYFNLIISAYIFPLSGYRSNCFKVISIIFKNRSKSISLNPLFFIQLLSPSWLISIQLRVFFSLSKSICWKYSTIEFNVLEVQKSIFRYTLNIFSI
ncbi:hypothetical protein CBF27_13780 [Vagococcus acidifermentans]|uniref:Uncharacterized protein n=1 Tax=Vagococcus acidifermentans TaxID=564710 RepID=A0A430ALH4_9ENTE|nr:hypothetical protein CBF27_13780 [Vagococcus acidifermentans]